MEDRRTSTSTRDFRSFWRMGAATCSRCARTTTGRTARRRAFPGGSRATRGQYLGKNLSSGSRERIASPRIGPLPVVGSAVLRDGRMFRQRTSIRTGLGPVRPQAPGRDRLEPGDAAARTELRRLLKMDNVSEKIGCDPCYPLFIDRPILSSSSRPHRLAGACRCRCRRSSSTPTVAAAVTISAITRRDTEVSPTTSPRRSRCSERHRQPPQHYDHPRAQPESVGPARTTRTSLR